MGFKYHVHNPPLPQGKGVFLPLFHSIEPGLLQYTASINSSNEFNFTALYVVGHCYYFIDIF
jgi:hypothetical protein